MAGKKIVERSPEGRIGTGYKAREQQPWSERYALSAQKPLASILPTRLFDQPRYGGALKVTALRTAVKKPQRG